MTPENEDRLREVLTQIVAELEGLRVALDLMTETLCDIRSAAQSTAANVHWERRRREREGEG